MNWKLIVQLSLFGLAMGIATVFFIPSSVEPLFWLAIFAISAYAIAARAGGRNFIHGVLVGIANSVWITCTHVLLFRQYIASHPREAEMMATGPLPTHPRVMMLLIGPVIGVLSGVVLGLFAIIASKMLKMRTEPAVSNS